MARKILIKDAQLINEGRAFSSDVRRAMSSGVSWFLSTQIHGGDTSV